MKSFSNQNSDSKDYARTKTIHSWVENYLREFPDLRDNPQRLFLFLWKMQHPNFKGSIDGLIALDKEDKLINAETAIRASRRIQERNIELRGANWEKNRVHDTSPLPLWERTFALEITLREVV